MFYGQYKDKDVQVSGTDYNYNLPLAYLVSVSCVMLFSLIMMVRQYVTFSPLILLSNVYMFLETRV